MRSAKSIVEFFSAMSAVDRFSQYRLVNPESVLEHTGMVAIMTMFICDQLDIGDRVELNALRHALCHDMDEILTGDICMPTKYHSPESKTMIDQIAHKNAVLIDKQYHINIIHDWEGDGQDVFIVKLADVMAVFYKTYQEIELFGNKTLIGATSQLAKGLLKSYDNLSDMIQEVRTSNLRHIVEEMIVWAESMNEDKT